MQARFDSAQFGNNPAVKLDDLGNPVCGIIVRRTERKDARMQNAIIKTCPQVL